MGSEHSGTVTSNSVVAQTIGKNLQKAYQDELSKYISPFKFPASRKGREGDNSAPH